MLIETGPRAIGKCDLKYLACTAKKIGIVKKVLLAKSGEAAWVCQGCLLFKLKKDYRETMNDPNPSPAKAAN